MPVDQFHDVNIEPEVISTLLLNDHLSEWQEPFDREAWASSGFVTLATKRFGPSMSTELTGLAYNLYRLLRKTPSPPAGSGQQTDLGELRASIAMKQEVDVEVESILLVRDTVAQADRTRISAAFDGYRIQEDAAEYFERFAQSLNVARADVMVLPRIIVVKKGARVDDERQARQLEALYQRGSGVGRIGPSVSVGGKDDDAGSYFRDSGYELVFIGRVPADASAGREPRNDNRRTIADIDDERPIEQIIDEQIQEDNTINDRFVCASIGGVNIYARVLSLYDWVEFKTDFRLLEYDIGCTKVKTHVPVIQTRTASWVLYGYGGVDDGIDNAIREQMMHCIVEAAKSGLVAGLVFWNLASALIAYKAHLYACLDAALGPAIPCYLAGLQQFTERSDWADV